jgi:23S rRNA G2069 N7-methylase RlmK/C1962 C5-methylase RlmI
VDPPAFGRGPKKSGRPAEWDLGKDLDDLLDLVSRLLSENALFALLTCHDPAIYSKTLAGSLSKSLSLSGHITRGKIVFGDVQLNPLGASRDDSNRRTSSVWSGAYARWYRNKLSDNYN